ncbi:MULTISPECIES: hypothetical protein [Rhizobium]|uniref:hypothetical protein n=1 Tax=Rhizobium TaxID=379 RepID=UPI001675FC90|nr:hypothetical protein [Rhizobium leguminosarum]WSH63679.1 hypothetical protein U8Q05_18805 [Rhizobium ruizarguesonis]
MVDAILSIHPGAAKGQPAQLKESETRTVLLDQRLSIQLCIPIACPALDRNDSPAIVTERRRFAIGIFSYR